MMSLKMNHLVRPGTRLLVCAAGILTLIACGGGGGGSSEPPAPGPGDVENFFPNAIGDAWYYNGLLDEGAQAPSAYFDEITVTGTQTVAGKLASVFFESNAGNFSQPEDGYFYKDDGGVTNLGNSDSTDYLNQSLVPYREALFPVVVGPVTDLSRSGISIREDLDGDGRNERVNFNYEIRIDGFDALTTPVGSFARTARRVAQVNGTLRTTSSGDFPFSATETSWWAPGAGLVRRRIIATTNGFTEDDLIEARGYVVGGTRRGISMPSTIAGNLAPADSSPSIPGQAAVASDGTRFLTVTYRQTSTVGSLPVGRIIGVFSDLAGTVTSTINVSDERVSAPIQGAALAFNGSNFLALFSRDNSDIGQSTSLRGQRISPTGDALDGGQGFEVAPPGTGFGAVASDGSSYLVVYTRFDNIQSRGLLYGVIVGGNGQVQAPGEFPLAIGPGINKGFPAVAFDGSNYLVAWLEESGSIYGTRVSPSGTVLDPAGILIAANANSGAVLASSGQNTLVASVQSNSIRGMRVAADGSLLDGTAQSGGFLINGDASTDKRSVALAFNGSEYFAAWAAGQFVNNPGPPLGIFAARITPGGTVVNGTSTPILVSGQPEDYARYEYPSIGVASGSSLLVWLDNIELSGQQKSQLGVNIWPFAQ